MDVYCRIQDRRGGGELEFKLWPGQASVTERLTSKFVIALKARQLGITWLIAAYCLWTAMFRFNSLVVIISAKEDLAIEFMDRVKFMFDRLPNWMKPTVYKRTTTELTFAIEKKDTKGNTMLGGLNSTIKSIPTTPDAGQSKTISLLVMDESALNRYCREIWSAAKPTLEHSDGQAIIISNPTKTMPGWSWTRDIYTSSMRGENEFARIFLDPFCVPGRGADFIDQQRRAGLDEDDIIMQYPQSEQEAISVLGGSYFGKHIAKYEPRRGEIGRLEKRDDQYVFERDERGIVEIWAHPAGRQYENRYAIGSDVSEGTGNTNSVAYVYDRMDQRYVASMKSSRIDADEWAARLIELATYYDMAYIGPERTGAGITTVIHLGKKYPRLYYRQRPGTMRGEYILEYGWPETNENKQILADELKRHLRDVFTDVPCAQLIDECSTFIRHDNGRLAHEDGKMDDCVIAAGVALQVSLFMPTLFDHKPKRRPSGYDKRLEALERAGQDDSYTVMAREQEAAFRELGASYYDADITGTIEDRGGAIPTIIE